MRLPIVSSENVLALEFDPTPRRRLQPHQTLEQFRPTRAKQPVYADDLAGLHVQRHMIDEKSPCRARQRDVLQRQSDLSCRRRLGLRDRAGRPDHLLDHPFDRDVLDQRVRLVSTISQDGHVVANSQNLFEPVRDVDDGDAVRLEIADDAEQDFHLRRAEGGGRFVHDQDVDIGGEGFRDLNDLLLANAQVVGERRRFDRLFQARKQGPRLVHLARSVDMESETGRRIDEAEVFGDTEIRAEVQFLKDDSDAVTSRIANRTRTVPPCR